MPSSRHTFNFSIFLPQGKSILSASGEKISVGRTTECDVKIEAGGIGRHHVNVFVRSGKVCVEDLQSTNGTFVNGQRLKPYTPTPVEPADQVHLGKTAWMTVALSSAPVDHLPEEVTETMTDHKSSRAVMEAQEKARAIIQAAELKAAEIERAAETSKFKIEQTYQRKTTDAFREAEELRQVAKSEAEDIRRQAEAQAKELRARTAKDCEIALEEALKVAQEMKQSRLKEADSIIAVKEEAVLKAARELMDDRIIALDSELDAIRSRQLREINSEIDQVKQDLRKFSLDADHKRELLADLEDKLGTKTSEYAALSKDLLASSRKRDDAVKEFSDVQSRQTQLSEQSAKLNDEIAGCKSRLVELHESERTLKERVHKAHASIDTDLLLLKEQMADTRLKFEKEEKDRQDQLQLETMRKFQALEREMYRELMDKKATVSLELSVAIEKFVKATPLDTPEANRELEKIVTSKIDTVLANLTESEKSGAKLNPTLLKRRERFNVRLTGAVMGAAFCWAVLTAYNTLTNEVSPIQRRVAEAEETKRIDLESRKFAPEQTPELRATYTESVIYTKGFSETYLKEEFQTKFLSVLAPYMLKTWRLDEDKSIQAIAAANSLVKELVEKRENIHPDFVKKGVEKMEELEAESKKHMIDILGSEVRYESFKKFEKTFYEQHLAD